MKLAFSIILFIGFYNNSFSQSALHHSDQENRLYNYLKDGFVVESDLLGYNGAMKSETWKRADSLFKNLSLSRTLAYFRDSSYVIKYYAYLRLLYVDEDMALRLLKASIADTTNLFFTFGDLSGSEHFNQLLVNEYGDFIYYRYKAGWTLDVAERHYFGNNSSHFLKANYKIWETKSRYLENLVHLHDINYQ